MDNLILQLIKITDNVSFTLEVDRENESIQFSYYIGKMNIAIYCESDDKATDFYAAVGVKELSQQKAEFYSPESLFGFLNGLKQMF